MEVMVVAVHKVSPSVTKAFEASLRIPSLKRDETPDFFESFPDEVTLRRFFHEIWARLEENMDIPLTSEEALGLFHDLVLYDIPDGTRSTLTVLPDVDVGLDAALYCIALIHTLKGLGAAKSVIMTHTSYNRLRGKEGLERILRLISKGAKPLERYANRHRVNVHWIGLGDDYELRKQLLDNFPLRRDSSFENYFLIDYNEDLLMDSPDRISAIPYVDVCVRHTKLNMSGGGWIPHRMLTSTFLYSQNGSLYSNWDFDELVAMCTLGLLAKLFNSGEGLVKMYGDLDEVKRRYQLRELKLHNERIFLRDKPRKLFVFGSAVGLHNVYY